MIKYFNPAQPDILVDMEGDPAIILRKFGLHSIEVEDPKVTEINLYRREYLNCTKSLCELANVVYNGKLENSDYRDLVLSI